LTRFITIFVINIVIIKMASNLENIQLMLIASIWTSEAERSVTVSGGLPGRFRTSSRFKLPDLLSVSMFNPDKDFLRILLGCLGKDGKSISALSKDLEAQGFKHHRLILTGYLRALADMNVVKERSVPPSKIYQTSKTPSNNVYETVGRSCKKKYPGNNDIIVYILCQLFKRPVFESELRLAGATYHGGRPAQQQEVAECRKLLKRSGNVVPTQDAFYPLSDYPNEMAEVMSDILIDSTDSSHLVLVTKQMRLI